MASLIINQVMMSSLLAKITIQYYGKDPRCLIIDHRQALNFAQFVLCFCRLPLLRRILLHYFLPLIKTSTTKRRKPALIRTRRRSRKRSAPRIMIVVRGLKHLHLAGRLGGKAFVDGGPKLMMTRGMK